MPEINKNFFWTKNGNDYAKIDGMFCEVLTKREYNLKGEVYNLYSAQKINKDEYFFIANNGNYYAHAVDLKKAIEDLQFKMIADKLKKEPIHADTMISIMYYRTVTGACEFGTKAWLEQNKLTGKEEMRADELLPMLVKTNAWGADKFKQLVTF